MSIYINICFAKDYKLKNKQLDCFTTLFKLCLEKEFY